MTQVSINPNTRNVLGDDRALYLKQLEEQDPNGFKALSNLIVDLTDAQEYVDNQPVKDLTSRRDPGQSDTELSGGITPSFSSGSGVSAGSGRNLLLDFFFKTPQGLVMGMEDLASLTGIAAEFFTMSPSQRYGYHGQAWHKKYTKPAVEAVKKLAPVAVKGYISTTRPTTENLPERAEFGGLVSDIASGIKEGMHERGAASLVEPVELAFPIVGKTAKILSGKSTTLSPTELRQHPWDDSPDVMNKRVRERAARREELFAEQRIEEDFYNRFEALKSELAQGMGKDITNWKEDVDLPVEIEAANYKKGGAYEAEWKGSRSVEDIENELDDVYADWWEHLGDRGEKGRVPRPIGELAKESLFKQMPEGYRSYYEDNARYKELDAEQRRIHDLRYGSREDKAARPRLESIQEEMTVLGQRISEYPESFRNIEGVENRLQVINATIWDAENEIQDLFFRNNPEDATSIDNIRAVIDGLELDRNELLQQKLAFPEIQKEVLARIEELGTYSKETLAVIDRALDQGFYALGYHASKSDIRFFDEDFRGKGTGGGDSKGGFFFASDAATSKAGLYTQSVLHGELLDSRPDIKSLFRDLEIQDIDVKLKKDIIKRDIQTTLLNNYLEDIDYTALDKSTRDIRDFFDRDIESQANIRARTDDLKTYTKAQDWPKNVDQVEHNLHWFFRLFRTDRNNVKPKSLTEVELGKLGLTYAEVKDSGISFTASAEILTDEFNVDFEHLASVSDSYDYSMWVGGKEIEIPEKVITTMESLNWLGFDNPVDALNVAFDMRHTGLNRSIIYDYDLKPAPFPGSISDETVERLRDLAVSFSNTSDKLNSLRKLRQKDSDFESLPLSKGLKNIFPRVGSLSDYGNVKVLTPRELLDQGLASIDVYTGRATFTGDQIKDNLNYFINEMDAYKALPNRSPVDFEGVPIFKEQVDGTITPLSLIKFADTNNLQYFVERLNAWRILSPEQKDKFADLLAAQYNESAKVILDVDKQLDDNVVNALKGDLQGQALPDIPPYKDEDGLVTAAWLNSPHPLVAQSRKGYVPPELLASYREALQSVDHINRSRIWAEVNAGTNTTKARLHIEDPYILDMKGGQYDQSQYTDAINAAKRAGNDAVIVRNVTDGGNVVGDVYIIPNSDQIRSVTAMYDPREAPLPTGVRKEYLGKYNKLMDEKKLLLRRVIELSNQRSRQSSLGLDDDFSAIDSELADLNLKLRAIGNSSFEMYGLKSGITQENMDILLAERMTKYQELDRLIDEIKLTESNFRFINIFDSDEIKSEHHSKIKVIKENRLAFIQLKKELNLSDGSIDLGLEIDDMTFVVPNNWDELNQSELFPEAMLPTKDIMASLSGLVVPLGIGGAAHTWLVNDANAQQELETELIPDDELTADIGNVLDTFDIPGLDSPEAKENFILRNKDWGYRISEKDKKRSKDLQKIHLWRTKELGGNDL
jgi:hypothetical protein